MFLAMSTQQGIAIGLLVVFLLAWLVYLLLENQASPQVRAEEFLRASNRAEPPSDEVFEGPRLDSFLQIALVGMTILSVGLPLYWVLEPGRQRGSIREFDTESRERGKGQFNAPSPKHPNAFACSNCHGAGGGGGAVKAYVPDIDPATGEQRIDANNKPMVIPVNWTAPPINKVALRYSRDQIKRVLYQGRNKMPSWHVTGGGPGTDQQVDDVINYLRFWPLEDDPEALAAYWAAWETNGYENDKALEVAYEVAAKNERPKTADALARAKELPDNAEKSDGELLFEMNCARCHTAGYVYGKPQAPGSGFFGPALRAESLLKQFLTADAQATFVKIGTPVDGAPYGANGTNGWSNGGMPHFGNILTDDQIAAIVDYERNLGK